MSRERDLVFGILAMRLKKLPPDALQPGRLETMLGGNGRPLVAAGMLTEADWSEIATLVQDTVASYGGDPAAALAALGGEEEIASTLGSPSGDDAPTLATTPLHDTANAPTLATGGQVSLEEMATRISDTASAATIVSAGPPPGVMQATGVIPAVQEHPGRYEEIRAFASGGMGKIWLMHDSHLGRDIALKQLLPDRLSGATFAGPPTAELMTIPIIARFLQEARITGQLEHPSIIPVYELGYRADGSLYYTMKFVRGRSMQQALGDAKDIVDRLKLLKHFQDLCYAIAYAHSRGVIHRDIKPLNVMIGEFGETVAIDWGIAKVRGLQDIHEKGLVDTVRAMRLGGAEATEKTEYGQTIGSPLYMPPEQAGGDPNAVDERSDVYALGAVLYTILAGQPPYKGMNVREFLNKVATTDPRPIQEIEPMAPKELIAVVNRAMQRKPENRYQNAKELVDEIEQYLSGGLVSAYEYKFSELVRRFIKRHQRVLGTAAAGTLALITLAVFSYIRVTQERNETRQKLYYANTALAQNQINEQLMAGARKALAEAPPLHRGWEWGHLQYLCNEDRATMKAGGRFTAFAGNRLITATTAGTINVTALDACTIERVLLEKSGFNFAIATSADGRRAAVAMKDAVLVFDTDTGAERFRYAETTPIPQDRRRYLALSPGGDHVAALCGDRVARVWHIPDAAAQFTLPVEQEQGFGLFFSPAGDRLLVARAVFGDTGWQRTFELFALPSGASMGRAIVPDPNSVKDAAFSPDGAWLAIGTDNDIQVWNVSEWRQTRVVEGARFDHPGTLAFTPDGSAIAAGTKDGDVWLWPLNGAERKGMQKAHAGMVMAIALSSDGRWLATGGSDRAIRLWALPQLELRRTLRGHDSAVLSLAFNADATRLASGEYDEGTKLWDLSNELDATPAGDRPAVAAAAGRIATKRGSMAEVWDIASGRRIATLAGHGGNLKSVALRADGAAALTIAREGGNDVLRIWEPLGGEPRAIPLEKNTDEAFFAAAPLLVLRQGASLAFFDAITGAPRGETPNIEHVVLSPSGARVAHATQDPQDKSLRHLSVIALPAMDTIATCAVQSRGSLKFAFSPDETRLAIGPMPEEGAETPALLWEFGGSAPPLPLAPQRFQATAFAFDPQHGRLATGFAGQGAIALYDRNPARPPRIFTGHAGPITDLAFSPDGQRLVSASLDATFKIWDVVYTGENRVILTLQSSARTAAGQVLMPRRVVFDPAAAWLLTLTDDSAPPFLLRAFPYTETAYPGRPDQPLQERIEAFKRARS
jgi:serine/threonine protein kinase/WD40 repeat protein